MLFTKEVKVAGEYFKGVISKNRDGEQAFNLNVMDSGRISRALDADDVRTFAYELLNVADEVDRANGKEPTNPIEMK